MSGEKSKNSSNSLEMVFPLAARRNCMVLEKESLRSTAYQTGYEAGNVLITEGKIILSAASLKRYNIIKGLRRRFLMSCQVVS